MIEQAIDWRIQLTHWLEQSSKTISDDAEQLRTAFLKRFPRETLADLTLEDYALGKPGNLDSFCYWIEFKTRGLGSVSGGSASKWGIYWRKADQNWKWTKALNSNNAEEAFQKIRKGIVALVEAAANNKFEQLDTIGNEQLGLNKNGLRAKPLSLYFPEKFLPIANPYHLIHFLKFFGQEPSGGLHSKNRQLLEFLQSQPEFEGIDTQQMMIFLYETIPPGDPKTKASNKQTDKDIPLPEELVELATLAETSRNLIIYGPPGTGKTYTVNRFAQFYLGDQLNSPITPEQRRRDLLQPLKWYEVIALAMYLQKEQKSHLKVPEIADERLVKEYWALTNTKLLSNQLWAILQIHTDPSVETVKYKNRQAPYLFEKTEQSDWFLTQEGRDYVEITLANLLDEIQESKPSNPNISDYLRFVTFHQSFAYEEFVEGLKPILIDGQISYEVVNGIFKSICHQAQNDPDHKYLLIIDEINRANIAKVFGELITLIEDDKRLETENEITVQLPYSQEIFGVPENLLLLGTMNTADRSVALLDIALRRRFVFVEKMPDPSLLENVEGVDLAALLSQLNSYLCALMGKDYQIGHSYFMDINDTAQLHFVWYRHIIPLLQEYFYNDVQRLRAVLGEHFICPKQANNQLAQSLRDLCDVESQYEVKVFEPSAEFLAALQALQGGNLENQVNSKPLVEVGFD